MGLLEVRHRKEVLQGWIQENRRVDPLRPLSFETLEKRRKTIFVPN